MSHRENTVFSNSSVGPRIRQTAEVEARVHKGLLPFQGGLTKVCAWADCCHEPASWLAETPFESCPSCPLWLLMGMTYKAVRTEQAKLIHWVTRDGVDELYDLAADPYELVNLIDDPARARERTDLRRELARLVVEALGL